MEPFALDVSLEVLEGSTYDLGHLTLWCRLRANTYNPARPRPQMDAVCRTNRQWSLTAREPEISGERVAELVGRLKALGWPGRPLQIEVAPGNIAGWQEVRLQGQLNGQEGEVRLILGSGCLTGPDAEALREIFRLLVDLGGLPSQELGLLGRREAVVA